MREILQSAATRASRYLKDIQERRVGPGPEAISALAAFAEPLPEGPTDPEAVLNMLDELGSPATMGIAGPRFFGFVIGGSMPASLAANWLATTWDQNAGLFLATPIAAVLEEVARKWLLDVLKLRPGCGAAFVTGATVANFTALAAARNSVLSHAGWDVEGQGLFGAPPVHVIISEEAHPSLVKSLGMLGLGRDRVTKVPVDEQGRMLVDAMPASVPAPAIICCQVGNVNSGAFDPVDEICVRYKVPGVWIHVDGAFGLWAAASPRLAHLTEGCELADSWATDAHKWLNVPYDSGLAFVRDAEALRAGMSLSASYLPPTAEHRDPLHYVPELSRRARGIDIWAAMKSLGRTGLAELIDRCCLCATRFAEGLSAAGFEILNEVVLNQVVVSFGDEERNAQVIRAIQEDGTCWCGPTIWRGRHAMRISVSSWATTEADVDRSLQAIIRLAGRVAGISRP